MIEPSALKKDLASQSTQSRLVFHPALFAILPIMKVWESCLGNYMPEQFMVIIAFVVSVTIAVQWVCYWRLKDSDKAGLLTTAIVATFFCWPVFRGISHNHLDELAEVAIYLLLCINACYLCACKIPARKLTWFLNLASLAIIPAAWPVLHGELLLEKRCNATIQSIRQTFPSVLPTSKQKPDIYYIVADAFANPHTLSDQYHYDSALIHDLKAKGFYIADRSFSNHDRTALSVPSSLNMRYMNDVLHASQGFPTQVFFRMLQNNEVAYLLKKTGYKFINVSSGWEPTDLNPFADENEASGPGCNLEINLLRLTVLEPFGDKTGLLAQLYRSCRMRCFEQPEQIVETPGPKFVLIHTCHPPFFLDSNGKPKTLSKRMMNEPYTQQAYLEQLKFGEKQIIRLIDTILSESNGQKPIIIVQSDHGPASVEAAMTTEYANERMRILNAFYLEGADSRNHPPSNITPVNIFRWVLNNYFGTSLPMLTNRAYAAAPFETGVYQDITNHITFPTERAPDEQQAATERSK